MTTLARLVSVLVMGLLVLTGAVAVAAVARSDDPARDRVTVTEQVREQTRQATQTQERGRTDLDRDAQHVRLHERDCTRNGNDRTRQGMHSQQRVGAQDRAHAPDDCVHRQYRDRSHGRDQLHARLRDGTCLADDAS